MKNYNQIKNVDDIRKLLMEELEQCNKFYPLFHSRHESYGVMKEELTELKHEIEDIEEGIEQDYFNLVMKTKLNVNIESRLVTEGYISVLGDKQTEKLLNFLEISIINAIKELIQLGAMVEKTKILERTNKNE